LASRQQRMATQRPFIPRATSSAIAIEFGPPDNTPGGGGG